MYHRRIVSSDVQTLASRHYSSLGKKKQFLERMVSITFTRVLFLGMIRMYAFI